MSALDDVVNVPDRFHTPKHYSEARAELAQLRAESKRRIEDLEAIEKKCAALSATVASQERIIKWLSLDLGQDGLSAINRLLSACERGSIAQQYAPDLDAARDEIIRHARQLAAAREVMEALKWDYRAESWLAANPAPLCTCGMGDATMPELHAKDCALLAPQQDKAQ